LFFSLNATKVHLCAQISLIFPHFLKKIKVFLKKVAKKFAQFNFSPYLCTRKSEMTRILLQ